MPRIVAQCPNCRTKYNLKDPKAVGKKFRCRKCETPFRINAPKAAAAAVDDFESDDYDPFAEFGNDDEPMELPAKRRRRRKPRKSQAEVAVDIEENESAEKKYGKPLVIVGIVGGSALMIGMIAVVVVGGPKLISRMQAGPSFEAPEKFEVFNPPDCALRLEYPAGWEIKHGGGTGGSKAWISIKHDDIHISIESNLVMSVVGDVGRAAGGRPFDPEAAKIPKDERPPELELVHNIHMLRLELLKNQNKDYEETPPEVIETRIGGARISEFTKPQSFGRTTYGYRATLPPGRNQYMLTCTCPKKQVQPLGDTLWRIIESISHGSRR